MTKDEDKFVEAIKTVTSFIIAFRHKDTEYIDIGHGEDPMKSQFFHEDSVYCVKRYVSRRLSRQVDEAVELLLEKINEEAQGDE